MSEGENMGESGVNKKKKKQNGQEGIGKQESNAAGVRYSATNEGKARRKSAWSHYSGSGSDGVRRLADVHPSNLTVIIASRDGATGSAFRSALFDAATSDYRVETTEIK